MTTPRRATRAKPVIAWLKSALGIGLIAVISAGCADGKAAGQDEPEQEKKPTAAPKTQQQLSAHAASAIDHVYTGDYRLLNTEGAQTGTVRVTKGSEVLRYDVSYPADAATIAHTMTLLINGDGTYRCITAATGAGCVLAAKPDAELDNDPRLQHVFSDWLPTLSSRSAPFSVEPVTAADAGLTPATGDCFSLEQLTSSVKSPVDLGVYCFDKEGAVTAVKIEAGTLIMTAAGAGPETITLPAAITTALPDINVPPPPPTPTPTP